MQWVVKGNLRGPKGEDGKGIKIVGNIEKWEDLPTDYTGIEEGDSYYNQEDGKLYTFNGEGFPVKGEGVPFRGETGERGTKWFLGEGEPEWEEDSEVGDIYLDLVSGDIYQRS